LQDVAAKAKEATNMMVSTFFMILVLNVAAICNVYFDSQKYLQKKRWKYPEHGIGNTFKSPSYGAFVLL